MSLGVVFGPGVTLLAIAILVVLIANITTLPRLGGSADRGPDGPEAGPDGRADPTSCSVELVSVLIPARNEADTIVECVEHVLAQEDIEIEVIVVDDRSDDATLALAAGIDDPRLTVVEGLPVPDGWTGKNWACHQLASRARGDVLCFVDADTRLAPTAVREAADALVAERAELLSCLVAGEYRTVSQAVLLPMVNHALLALFPVALMRSARFPRVALALGPFLLVRADTYRQVGGHAARPSDIVDDVGLSRAVKGAGGRVRLANGTAVATTRWYPTASGMWNGFSKNAFGALDGNTALAALTCLVLVPMLLAPFVRLGAGALGGSVSTEVLAQVCMLLLARVMTAAAGHDPVWSAPLHPVAVVFWGATLANSAVLAHRGRTIEWRGRQVPVTSR